jgi:NAD(P)-dependent dehydrogenase (short-subunit alcohol dehydrogenase family)
MREFEGKTAVVTGAGSGIGRSLGLAFARQGMRVALVDLDRPAVEKTVAVIEAELPDADVVSFACDVGNAEEVGGMADAVFDRWEQVHILCNNAGVFVGGLIWDRPAEDFEFALAANLWGILNGIRSFVPRMITQQTEGHVVNTSSVAGLFGAPFEAPYAVSKFAAFAATESLAQDLRAVGSKLKASVLCPGIIATRIADSERHRPAGLATEFTEDQKFVTDYLAQVIAEGMDPDEVAPIVLDAIRSERFLILTHDAYLPQLKARVDALSAGRVPDLPDLA